MKPVGHRLKRHAIQSAPADPAKYRQIVDDMLLHGKELVPDPNWLIAEARSKPAHSYNREDALAVAADADAFTSRFSKFEEMMPAWIGPEKTQAPAPVAIEPYRILFDRWDPLKLWDANVTKRQFSPPLIEADLGTMMDLSLIYSFAKDDNRPVTRILEVGGGYGRVAEAAWNVFERGIKYVLVDSVPATLYFCAEYLRQACPEAKVVSYYDKDAKLGSADLAIVPAWHFAECFGTSKFDVCVNIQSFQEMNQFHVDFYLALFNKVTEDGGTIFLDNNHDYYFKGSWNYPENWQKLVAINTPRWVTSDHPIEIFRKQSTDFSQQNAALDAIYRFSLWRGQPEPSQQADRLANHSFKSLASEAFGRIPRKVARLVRG